MLKEKIDAFVDGQLEVIQNRLRSGFPQSSEIPEEDEEKRQANEALMVIIKYILRGTDQDTMAEWISGLEQTNETGPLNWSEISSGSGPGSVTCNYVR